VSNDDQKAIFVQRLRDIVADPDNVWGLKGRETEPSPGKVHEPADQVLLDALRVAGWGEVAEEYDRAIEACGGFFWYE